RNVDAIEAAIVCLTILEMVDDLQGCAQRIRGWPHRLVLPVNVKHKAANRHCRIGTVADEVIPVAITQLGRIETKCGQQVLGVARGHTSRRKRGSQRNSFGVTSAATLEIALEFVKQRDLLTGRELRVIRNIVGCAHELIERENEPAMARVDK